MDMRAFIIKSVRNSSLKTDTKASLLSIWLQNKAFHYNYKVKDVTCT